MTTQEKYTVWVDCVCEWIEKVGPKVDGSSSAMQSPPALDGHCKILFSGMTLTSLMASAVSTPSGSLKEIRILKKPTAVVQYGTVPAIHSAESVMPISSSRAFSC